VSANWTGALLFGHERIGASYFGDGRANP
jgi:hypothetical protein